MTYRERREAEAERLREWAAKREERAAAVFKQGERFHGDFAFNTQPGHIPERARLIAREDRAHESLRKAQSMESRAAGIQTAAGRAIYSDDSNAVEALTSRIASLEAKRERCKAINKEIRTGSGWSERIDPPLTDQEKRDLTSNALYSQTIGYPAYHLSNLGGNISRQKARLAQLKGESE
ncbi:MAG TPA: hypothetical protein DCS05_01815 [Nitrospiraceae bacterium]|nr:hypothetical protein [Nitrospiraceae bacterium]